MGRWVSLVELADRVDLIEATVRLNRGKVLVVEREPRVVVRFIYWTKESVLKQIGTMSAPTYVRGL